MTYSVKEIYYTLQGEGAQAGRAAVFLRFAGCNLWTGLEADRGDAVCQFCDTDFVGTDGRLGGKYTASELAAAVGGAWLKQAGNETSMAKTKSEARPLVVCTGGEPLLQLDQPAIDALHKVGFEVAIETNGTLPVPSGVDWVCVSPKAGAELVVHQGDELKLVFPQPTLPPGQLAELDFEHFYLQPMDGPDREANTRAVVAYCLAHPQWRLSLQTHKYIGID